MADSIVCTASRSSLGTDPAVWELHARVAHSQYFTVTVSGMTAAELGYYLSRCADGFTPSASPLITGGQLVARDELSEVVGALDQLCIQSVTQVVTARKTVRTYVNALCPTGTTYATHTEEQRA